MREPLVLPESNRKFDTSFTKKERHKLNETLEALVDGYVSKKREAHEATLTAEAIGQAASEALTNADKREDSLRHDLQQARAAGQVILNAFHGVCEDLAVYRREVQDRQAKPPLLVRKIQVSKPGQEFREIWTLFAGDIAIAAIPNIVEFVHSMAQVVNPMVVVTEDLKVQEAEDIAELLTNG